MLTAAANSKNSVASMKEVNANTVIHLLNSTQLQVLASLKIAYKLMLQDACFASLPLLFQTEPALYPTAMSSKTVHVCNAREVITSKKEYSVN